MEACSSHAARPCEFSCVGFTRIADIWLRCLVGRLWWACVALVLAIAGCGQAQDRTKSKPELMETAFEPKLLYGPDNKPLNPDHALYRPAIAKYRSHVYREIDDILRSLPEDKLRSPDELKRSLRSALKSDEFVFHLDTGKLDIPDRKMGRVRIRSHRALRVYVIASAIASAVTALNIDRFSPSDAHGWVSVGGRVRIPAGSFLMGAVPGHQPHCTIRLFPGWAESSRHLEHSFPVLHSGGE